ncbi:hypothetical protein BUE68_12710, partial [Corynebacterium diphtheriae]
ERASAEFAICWNVEGGESIQESYVNLIPTAQAVWMSWKTAEIHPRHPLLLQRVMPNVPVLNLPFAGMLKVAKASRNPTST